MRIFGHVQTPLPPCTHLYALVLTPTPTPLDAYISNGRPQFQQTTPYNSYYTIYTNLANIKSHYYTLHDYCLCLHGHMHMCVDAHDYRLCWHGH